MARITTERIEEKDLTILTTAGKSTSAEEIRSALLAFYSNKPTANLLWKFTQTEASDLTNAQLQQIFAISKEHGHLRAGGKTALVMANDLGFGLGRMYQILCEIELLPISIQVFRSCEEAEAWLETQPK